MKKEFIGSGKGMKPKTGYNAKKWYANFDLINWSKKNGKRQLRESTTKSHS